MRGGLWLSAPVQSSASVKVAEPAPDKNVYEVNHVYEVNQATTRAL